MKLSTPLMYAGNPREAADQVVELEKAGLDTVWVAEAYGFDSPTLMGYLAAEDRHDRDRRRDPERLLAHARRCSPDRGRAGQRLGRTRDPRARRVRPAGDRGLARHAYSRPLGRTREAIEIIRRGAAPRGDRVRRQDLPAAAARGPGHRPRQAAEDADPARAQQRPDLPRRARPQDRRGRRGVRRRLAAVPVPARRARQVWGDALAAGTPSAATTWPRSRSQRAGWSRSARTSRTSSTSPARWRALRRRHGRARQELLQRPRLPVRLREGGQGDPGPLPRRQEEGSRGRRTRSSCWSGPTSSAPRATSRSGSRRSGRRA